MQQPSREALVDSLRRVLASGPQLRFAILFGSRARGTARPDSDVDIAIAPVRELSLSDENALALEIERCIGASLDIVLIDRASPTLRWRIARDGIVIMSSPRSEATRFLAATGIEHADLLELEQEALRRYRAALARAHK